MPNVHTEYAYAKINPFLAVMERRPDGYHTILSHMQAVTLCDVLTLDWQEDNESEFTVRLQCTDPAIPCDDTNLVCRAARALVARLKDHGRRVGGVLNVHLEKRIPVAAGLAGGSADAAATLRGFNTLLYGPFSLEELCKIGATLGADVPFCVQCEKVPAVRAHGIGDIMEPACPLPDDTHLVIARFGEGVSTPWAYRQLDEHWNDLWYYEAIEGYKFFAYALDTKDLKILAPYTYNCFETMVMGERPSTYALAEHMENCKAVFVRMSGSGPSMVGYFDDEEAAKCCADKFHEYGIEAHLCQPLKRKVRRIIG